MLKGMDKVRVQIVGDGASGTTRLVMSGMPTADVPEAQAQVLYCGAAHEMADQASMDQLTSTLSMHATCIQKAVVMPDIHAGPGAPVGVAYLSHGVLLPKLIGCDIGCGMTLFSTGIKHRASIGAKLAKRLQGVTAKPLPDVASILAANGMGSSAWDDQLGSLGGGNHFAEFQTLHAVHDQAAWDSLGLSDKDLVLLVHSGSRGFGAAIAAKYDSVLSDPQVQRQYLEEHDMAVEWALANRMLLAHIIVAAAGGGECNKCINIVHNFAETRPDGTFLHRKGVGKVNPGQLTIIPGSRGSPSFVVRMSDDAALVGTYLNSVSHGAGRKVTRTKALALLQKASNSSLKTTSPLGPAGPCSHVVCNSGTLLREEHESMYKDVRSVVDALVAEGLISIVAELIPVCTYKN